MIDLRDLTLSTEWGELLGRRTAKLIVILQPIVIHAEGTLICVLGVWNGAVFNLVHQVLRSALIIVVSEPGTLLQVRVGVYKVPFVEDVVAVGKHLFISWVQEVDILDEKLVVQMGHTLLFEQKALSAVTFGESGALDGGFGAKLVQISFKSFVVFSQSSALLTLVDITKCIAGGVIVARSRLVSSARSGLYLN